MDHFNNRYSQSLKAPDWFLKELREIHGPLDCYFNRIENRWQVIQWEGAPMNSRFFWVMTLQSPNAEPMDPCQYSLDRVRWLKKIFSEDQAQQIVEADQSLEEERSDKLRGDIMHELSKDLRKPLLAAMDGVVSTWNRFI